MYSFDLDAFTRQYLNGDIRNLADLSLTAMIAVYEITPSIKPYEMEYVNGIAATGMNAGSASSASCQSMSAHDESIM